MKNLCVINLNTLKNNAKKIKRLLPKTTLFNAVVKADGYGHGIQAVALALYQIVDSYSVAIVEEGVALRNCGIDKDILILIPIDCSEIKRALNHNLVMGVDSLPLIEKINAVAKSLKVKARLHIKFNSGMNRLGVDTLEELTAILKRAKQLKWVKIEGLYSHYGEPSDKNMLKTATDKFLLAKNAVKVYNNKAICHISASGGFVAGQYFDMVRIGILLYGYLPYATDKIKVKPIMKVYSRLVKTRVLSKGQTALYGKVTAKTQTKISLVRLGYADGLFRAKIRGQFNNRCMDITAIKGHIKNSKVLIFDNAQSLAKEYKTIPYEILVKAPIRADKKYIY